MKKLRLIAVVAGGLMFVGRRVLMLKFTSVSDSDRAIMDIIRTGTIIPTGITDLIIIVLITGASLTRNSHDRLARREPA